MAAGLAPNHRRLTAEHGQRADDGVDGDGTRRPARRHYRIQIAQFLAAHKLPVHVHTHRARLEHSPAQHYAQMQPLALLEQLRAVELDRRVAQLLVVLELVQQTLVGVDEQRAVLGTQVDAQTRPESVL
ncbi:hypothetical protein BpHYR1_006004 [Brachionus plicatilis]|uniref:Uncharacterized protein n=1 Tax=Brachionus plicatilis TaxID=10195 RepID=A0A3M7SWB5_BRAPC|nr:hypothetical protein BpHYR1_006004 [Brachionus plicatilis]